MARFFHIVGDYGVGKSTLAEAIAAWHEARGRRCVTQGWEEFVSREQTLRDHPGAEVYVVEHLDDKRLAPAAGDTVIRMEHAKAGAA